MKRSFIRQRLLYLYEEDIMNKLKKIILAFSLSAAVLFTGCSLLDTPANGNNEVLNNNGDGFVNNNNDNNNNNNGDDFVNNNDNDNNNNNGGSYFTVGGQEFQMVNAVYGQDSNGTYTYILFEGTLDSMAALVVAATTSGVDDSATYYQNDFGNSAEVLACVIDTNTMIYMTGYSATQGISDAQITLNGNMEVSTSGTLNSDYGDVAFAVSSTVSSTEMTNIQDKLNAYDQAISSSNRNTGENDGTPMRCPDCRGSLNCRSCRGDGTCHICVEGMTHCLSCNGSRVCQHCGGRCICPYCNGTGYVNY